MSLTALLLGGLSAEANANILVHVTNSSGFNGKVAVQVGLCRDGKPNTWTGLVSNDGTASGTLSCPLHESAIPTKNDGSYNFSSLSSNIVVTCDSWHIDDVSSIIKNLYHEIDVTVSKDKSSCTINRTFK